MIRLTVRTVRPFREEDEAAKRERSKADSERMRRTLLTKLWPDPEFRKRVSERSRQFMLRLHADPEFRKANAKRMSDRMKRMHQDPAFKTKLIAGQKKWQSIVAGKYIRRVDIRQS